MIENADDFERNAMSDSEKPLGIRLSDLTVTPHFEERLSIITAAHVEAAHRRLKPRVAERILGTIESDSTKVLYALWRSYSAEALMELGRATSAIDESTEKTHRERHAIADMLGDVAKEMFWAQAKMDLHLFDEENISITSGWHIVATGAGPDGVMQILSRMPFPTGGGE